MEGARAEVRGGRRERVGSKVVFIVAVVGLLRDGFLVCLSVFEGLLELLLQQVGFFFVRVESCCDRCARNVTVGVLTFPRVPVAEATPRPSSR